MSIFLGFSILKMTIFLEFRDLQKKKKDQCD